MESEEGCGNEFYNEGGIREVKGNEKSSRKFSETSLMEEDPFGKGSRVNLNYLEDLQEM